GRHVARDQPSGKIRDDLLFGQQCLSAMASDQVNCPVAALSRQRKTISTSLALVNFIVCVWLARLDQSIWKRYESLQSPLILLIDRSALQSGYKRTGCEGKQKYR
ncbi:MAG: hypothetical protein MUO26_12030, partial [Methanotrichaceae archaeon]|nr:hypothetical protein [Methanotrichaceae archaeon]